MTAQATLPKHGPTARYACGTTSWDPRAVDQWIALLDNVDLSSINELEALLAQIPAALIRRVGDEGGPLIREKLVAPAMAELERKGMVERTGRVAPNGQRIWRSLVYKGPRSTNFPESDKT